MTYLTCRQHHDPPQDPILAGRIMVSSSILRRLIPHWYSHAGREYCVWVRSVLPFCSVASCMCGQVWHCLARRRCSRWSRERVISAPPGPTSFRSHHSRGCRCCCGCYFTTGSGGSVVDGCVCNSSCSLGGLRVSSVSRFARVPWQMQVSNKQSRLGLAVRCGDLALSRRDMPFLCVHFCAFFTCSQNSSLRNKRPGLSGRW